MMNRTPAPERSRPLPPETAHQSLADSLRELWAYRELLLILVIRDLKVRYKNSFLGFGWSLLNPLLQVLIITLVVRFLMDVRAPNYHAYVFCATLPWLFFNTGLLDAAPSLLMYREIIRRTYFPREIVPLSTVLSGMVHFILSTLVFILYMGANSLWWWSLSGRLEWPLQASVLLIPIPMLGLALFLGGLAFFISVWTLYFEDLRFILDSVMKIAYWLVPVLYFADIILRRKGPIWYGAYMLNPVSAFINSFRKLALVPAVMPGDSNPTTPMGSADWFFTMIAFASSALLFILGYRYFCSRKWSLAERA